MAGEPGVADPSPRKRKRRGRALLAFGLCVLVLELCARMRLARPLGLIRHSDNPATAYENVPGTYVGTPTYDVWKAPMFTVWDLVRSDDAPVPEHLPPGAALYRIDADGCRAPSTGPLTTRADVVMTGSSQAFGMLLPEEESVPGMLERALRTDGFTGVRVANCSVVGYRLLQTLAGVERVAPLKHAKLAVILIRPWHLSEPFPYADVMAPRNRLSNWLIRHSALCRLVHYLTWVRAPQPRPLTREQIARGLDAYATATHAAGFASLFVLLDERNTDRRMLEILATEAQAHGMGVERVAAPAGPNDMFLDNDHHWSIRGGAVVTGLLHDRVVRELRARYAAEGAPAP